MPKRSTVDKKKHLYFKRDEQNIICHLLKERNRRYFQFAIYSKMLISLNENPAANYVNNNSIVNFHGEHKIKASAVHVNLTNSNKQAA